MAERGGDPVESLRALVGGFRLSQAVHVAAVLAISDCLSEGPRTAADLARATEADEVSLRRLMRALAAAGVYREAPADTFANTAMGEALRSDHPSRTKDIAANHGRPYFWNAWGHLLESVETGENAFAHLNGHNVWNHRIEHPDDGAAFDKAMTAMTLPAVEAVAGAYDFTQTDTVVDIGGGQGALIAAVLRAAPNSRGVLFDQPQVVATAPDFLREAGVEDRVTITGGDFFTAIPPGGDVYLLKSVLHDWDDDDCIRILRTCRQAMRAGTKVLLVERTVAGPNEGLDTKLSDLNMMVMPGGRERSAAEYGALLELAGFLAARVLATSTSFSLIEAAAT